MRISNARLQACDQSFAFAIYLYVISGLIDTEMKNLFPSLLKSDTVYNIPFFFIYTILALSSHIYSSEG
jgi:hypothetical protein